MMLYAYLSQTESNRMETHAFRRINDLLQLYIRLLLSMARCSNCIGIYYVAME